MKMKSESQSQSKVGIVGYGYVGKAMYNCFKTKFNTIWYDPYLEGSCTKEDINNCDLAIVCVMTPTNPDNGSCDVSIVQAVVDWIASPLIMIKSTVAPGTTDALIQRTGKRIVFSPEYIGESDYDTGKHDFNLEVKKTSFVTIGGSSRDVGDVMDFFVSILGPNKVYHTTDAVTAEIAKYMENCYLATKVVFSYEFERICSAFGASYHAVRECWLLDPRMESSHSAVFPNNMNPFDGKCLPKDVRAIIVAAEDKGYEAKLLKEVLQSNERIGMARMPAGSKKN